MTRLLLVLLGRRRSRAVGGLRACNTHQPWTLSPHGFWLGARCCKAMHARRWTQVARQQVA